MKIEMMIAIVAIIVAVASLGYVVTLDNDVNFDSDASDDNEYEIAKMKMLVGELEDKVDAIKIPDVEVTKDDLDELEDYLEGKIDDVEGEDGEDGTDGKTWIDMTEHEYNCFVVKYNYNDYDDTMSCLKQ